VCLSETECKSQKDGPSDGLLKMLLKFAWQLDWPVAAINALMGNLLLTSTLLISLIAVANFPRAEEA
jgi:hypothetical protein